MRRVLVAVVLVALLSTAVVTIAIAATNYVLAPSRATLNQPAGPSHSAVYRDDIHPADFNHTDGPGQADRTCPLHSNAAATDSSPSY